MQICRHELDFNLLLARAAFKAGVKGVDESHVVRISVSQPNGSSPEANRNVPLYSLQTEFMLLLASCDRLRYEQQMASHRLADIDIATYHTQQGQVAGQAPPGGPAGPGRTCASGPPVSPPVAAYTRFRSDIL